MRVFRIAMTAVLVLAACLVAGEAGRRVLDGYRLTSLRLAKDPKSLDLTWSEPDTRSADTLLTPVPADAQANAAWFATRPAQLSAPQPGWVDDRRVIGNSEANYVWNTAALNEPTLLAYLNAHSTTLPDIFTFTAAPPDPHPRYRFYPGIQSGFGITNRFGWKGGDIAPAKPRGVIRIAMLGDSTTNNYPGMVGHWLNLWATDAQLGARFEVINAARPAADALDAAAILERELAPFDPDYVIVYGFGNAISTADTLIELPPRVLKSAPATGNMPVGRIERWSKAAGTALDPLTPWSAAAQFVKHRIAGERGDSLAAEPPKPATQVIFPADIDEQHPDPDAIAKRRGGRLMGLDLYLQALNRMDAFARQHRVRLFTSTFRVLASDGLLMPRGGDEKALYEALNEYWWPYTYAEIHRIVAFFNRTLHAWADRTGNGILPIDEQMPWRRDLYGDGMHERPAGEALHAWIVLQQLMPVIREDLREHRLPRQSPVPPLDEQYWKIARMTTAAAIATANAMNAAIPPPPSEEIAGAFMLSKIVAADSNAEVAPGSPATIRTSLEPSAYAASLSVEPAVASQLRGRGWIDVKMRVTEGRLSVGVLNQTGTKFLAASDASQAPGVQTIQLNVENLAEAARLIVSNDRGQERARSTGELVSVEVRRLREP